MKSLQNPAETANKIIHIASFTVTLNDILHALEKATGTQWKVERTKSKDEIATAQQKLRDGDLVGAAPHLIRATWYSEGRGANYADEFGLDNDMLGLPHEDLESVVKELVRESG